MSRSSTGRNWIIALWACIKDDELLKALKAYGRTTSHKKPMEGAPSSCVQDESIVR